MEDSELSQSIIQKVGYKLPKSKTYQTWIEIENHQNSGFRSTGGSNSNKDSTNNNIKSTKSSYYLGISFLSQPKGKKKPTQSTPPPPTILYIILNNIEENSKRPRPFFLTPKILESNMISKSIEEFILIKTPLTSSSSSGGYNLSEEGVQYSTSTDRIYTGKVNLNSPKNNLEKKNVETSIREETIQEEDISEEDPISIDFHYNYRTTK